MPQVVVASSATSVALIAGSGIGLAVRDHVVGDDRAPAGLSCGIVNVAPFMREGRAGPRRRAGSDPGRLHGLLRQVLAGRVLLVRSKLPANEAAPSLAMPRLFIAAVKLASVAPVTGTASRKSIPAL